MALAAAGEVDEVATLDPQPTRAIAVVASAIPDLMRD
jgi:hypothetical protein